MASLVKRSGSPFWFAAFDVVQADGSSRRLKKSTKRAKRSEAMIEAVRLENLAKVSSSSTNETGDKAYSILADAASSASKGELSEARARELIARLFEASSGEPLRFYTVRSWTADWLAVKSSTSKKSTLARYQAHLSAFLAWLGDKADAKLEVVTKTEVRTFRDDIRNGWIASKLNQGKTKKALPNNRRTAKTSNHYAKDVGAMFRAAVREGLLLASPCSALEILPEHDSIQREVFTMAEVGNLVEAAGSLQWQNNLFSARAEETRLSRSQDWQGVILIGFYTGARLGDCARLKWGNIDLTRKQLTFTPAKTERKKKSLEVPLHPRLLSYLESREEGTTKDSPVFPALAKTPVNSGSGLSTQFVEIMRFAGIDRRTVRIGTKGGQRAQHARSFHAMRHSLTRKLANFDVPEEIRRAIVGHDSAAVHSGYTHHERETLARAIGKIPSI